VADAQEVIGDNPLVSYIQADLREPAAIFDAADQLFGGERRIAIGFIGLTYFLDDQSVVRLARLLYDWAAPGSVMALSYVSVQTDDEHTQERPESFRRNSAEVYIRDQDQISALMAPWKVHKVRLLASWLGVEHLVEESAHEGIGADMYGVILGYEEQPYG
jgi:O-methyltransferase involved in polyketide biosynthesis